MTRMQNIIEWDSRTKVVYIYLSFGLYYRSLLADRNRHSRGEDHTHGYNLGTIYTLWGALLRYIVQP